MPHFYLKPKVHKEGNPGRPVISSINCHTSKISEYADYHLQPIVKEILSYAQPIFLGGLIKLTLFQTTHTLFL